MSDVVWRMSYVVLILYFKYGGFIRSDPGAAPEKQNEQYFWLLLLFCLLNFLLLIFF